VVENVMIALAAVGATVVLSLLVWAVVGVFSWLNAGSRAEESLMGFREVTKARMEGFERLMKERNVDIAFVHTCLSNHAYRLKALEKKAGIKRKAVEE
jgi:hypothetical protein